MGSILEHPQSITHKTLYNDYPLLSVVLQQSIVAVVLVQMIYILAAASDTLLLPNKIRD